MRKNVTGELCGNRIFQCLLAAAGLLWVPAAGRAQAPVFTISSVVGGLGAGYSGDSGPANQAQINQPCAVTVDGSGNIYIGDQLNYVVRKITTDGNINTIVGTNTAGDSGAGGAATAAEIRTACGLAVDGSGNLFLSDTPNEEIKEVAASNGNISTIAGTGTGGYTGDNHLGTQAEVNNPTGIVLDPAGNLYIADSGNHVIRVLAPAGGNITPLAGNATAGYLGDNGPAGAAELNNPTGVARDAAGNLYVADTNNGVIRKITPGGGTITTIAGTGANGYSGDGGPAINAQLNNPRGVAVDAQGNIFIADTVNQRIRMITPDGIIHTVAGVGGIGYSGDSGDAIRAALNFPTALSLDNSGNVYIADSQNSAIRVLTRIAILTTPPAVSGVISASDFGAFSGVAPGSWIEVYGSNLAGVTRLWSTTDFVGIQAPISLDRISVTIAGQHAFISAISPGQVNVQVPSNVLPGPQPLTVTTPVGTSAPLTITVKAAQPGLYAPALLRVNGDQYSAQAGAAAGTFVMPANAVSNLTSQPANVGDTIVLYGVGFGPVTPSVNAGQIVQGLNALQAPVQFSIGGMPATATYAGLAPQAVGLYQFNLVVPNVAPADAVPVTFTLGGVPGTQTLYIAVQASQ